NGDYFAAIDFAYLGFGSHSFDGFPRDLHAFLGNREDIDRSIVFDVDFAAGLLDQPFDVLAARPDQGANLFRIDLQSNDARSVLAQSRAGAGKVFRHFSENGKPGYSGFFNRLGHQAMRHTAELQVELKAGDSLFGSCEFAIHVAEGVFPADDVGQEFIAGDLILIIMLGAEADADAGDRPGHWNTGIHQSQRAAANRGHGG